MGKIWSSDLPTDGKTFLWRVLNDSLFTGSRAKRIGKSNCICGYCKVGAETVHHIFSKCRKAIDAWDSTARYHDRNADSGAIIVEYSLLVLIDSALAARPEAVARLFVISQAIWEFWLIMNTQVFEGRFNQFSAAKITILMVERMKAMCYCGAMTRSKMRILRGIRYIVMPRS